MPIDELESHPFLDYDMDNGIDPTMLYEGLIIGSFPVYSCTHTLGNNLQVIQERFEPNDVSMRFFYCSRRSKFWHYCSSAFGEVDPTIALPGDNPNDIHDLAKQRTIDFLNRNSLLITDVIRQTNRLGTGDEDSNLWITQGANEFITRNLQRNQRVIELIEENIAIENLYFTATGLNRKSPFGWFREIYGDNLILEDQRIIDGRPWGLICNINGRRFKAFLLPTPKPRGIHFTDNQRTLMFVNFLLSRDIDFYNEIRVVPKNLRTRLQKQTLETYRFQFLVECYRQALIENNLDFNGTVLA